MFSRFSGGISLKSFNRVRNRICHSTIRALSSDQQLSVRNDFSLTTASIETQDKELWNLIQNEHQHQRETLSLSPTSNYASSAVMDTLQTVLQNKYSEGYPGARYYGGNENVDEAELLCQTRALQLFKLDANEWKCNVQSLTNNIALLEICTALLQTHSKIFVSANNSIGLHTSALHEFYDIITYDKSIDNKSLISKLNANMIISGNGCECNFNDIDYQSIHGLIKDNESIFHVCDISDIAGQLASESSDGSPFDMCDVVICSPFCTLRGPRGGTLIFMRESVSSLVNAAVFPGHQGGPHNHTISAMATALDQAQSLEFKQYQQRVSANSNQLEKELIENGFCESVLRSNYHCINISCSKEMYEVMDACNIHGLFFGNDCDITELRLSSLAMSTRGADIQHFTEIARILVEAKKNIGKPNDWKQLKQTVISFVTQFPMIGDF